MADTFTVTGQIQTQSVLPGGSVVDGFEVTFTTTDGTVGRVFVPLTEYGPERVRELIEDVVQRVEAVAQL